MNLADNPLAQKACRDELENWRRWSLDEDSDKLGYPAVASGFRYYQSGKALDERLSVRKPIDEARAQQAESTIIAIGQLGEAGFQAYQLLIWAYLKVGHLPSEAAEPRMAKKFKTSPEGIRRMVSAAEQLFWENRK